MGEVLSCKTRQIKKNFHVCFCDAQHLYVKLRIISCVSVLALIKYLTLGTNTKILLFEMLVCII